MLNIVNKAVGKLFGSKSDRDLKELWPYVEKVNTEYAKLASLDHDGLRAKTNELRGRLAEGLKDIDDQLADLHSQVATNPDMDIHAKEELFEQVDKLEESRNERLEELLNDILPEAFAVVKDTARRFKENEVLEVTATEKDRSFASRFGHVELKGGNTAAWHNSWEAAGNTVTWDMVHYDVQIIGGVVLHQGKISEMATGEGKTLVATFPAFLNALAGRGVHLVTVNDYLAKRDSEWNAPLFQFHGLEIDCIDKHQPNSTERRNAYLADITYGTNNEFGFDYLRDNMAWSPEDLVQRKHHFAMVDEVDSVLVDEARTPLIISGPVPRGDVHEYDQLKPRINKLVEAQRKMSSEFLQKAKRLIKEGNNEEGGLALFRSHRSMPKYKPLIKFLSEDGMRQLLQKTESVYLAENEKRMPEADEPLLFTIDERNNAINLTEKGIETMTRENEDANFFILPDMSTGLDAIENEAGLSDEDRLKKKEALIQDYTAKSSRIHTMNQLLKAYTLFEKDVEYIIVDNKVKIVDEQTGRVMDGRRYSDGLHQAIEAKENVKVEDATQTYATVTLQNYFRMYHKLSGMTGTAETEAGELWEIYKLDVVVIPTNRPIARDDRNDLVYKTAKEKYAAAAEEIVELTKAGRPVLVGTTSVENSELLSRMLGMRKIEHQVLNAKQHAREADVVAEAGKPGRVTIATNMAGRGTDIKLSKESREAGGLAIIGTERHDSRRVDRQLRGRAGRQGDVGSSQFFVSLEDHLMRLFGSERVAKMMDRMGYKEGEVLQHKVVTNSIERAQKKVEENNFSIRKRLLEYDDVMNQQREVIYTRRRNALYGERLQLDIMNMFYDTSEDVVGSHKPGDDYDGFRLAVLGTFGIDYELARDEFKAISEADLAAALYEKAFGHYTEKVRGLAEAMMPGIANLVQQMGDNLEPNAIVNIPLTDGQKQLRIPVDPRKAVETEGRDVVTSLEKTITLALIDQGWKEHLREMDDLKSSVQNARYEQKDPLVIYKFESFELFKGFLSKINEEVTSFLSKAGVPAPDPNQQQLQAASRQRRRDKVQTQKADADGGRRANADAGKAASRPAVQKTAPIKSGKSYGRNDKVTVKYVDGTEKKDVKFKQVEQDLAANRCVIIED